MPAAAATAATLPPIFASESRKHLKYKIPVALKGSGPKPNVVAFTERVSDAGGETFNPRESARPTDVTPSSAAVAATSVLRRAMAAGVADAQTLKRRLVSPVFEERAARGDEGPAVLTEAQAQQLFDEMYVVLKCSVVNFVSFCYSPVADVVVGCELNRPVALSTKKCVIASYQFRARTPDSPFAQYFLKEFEDELGMMNLTCLRFLFCVLSHQLTLVLDLVCYDCSIRTQKFISPLTKNYNYV